MFAVWHRGVRFPDAAKTSAFWSNVAFVCELVQRLRFFRSLDPLPADGRLLARPLTKEALVRQLRNYLHQVCHSLGISTRIVPHQMRHTYASEMLRPGVGFPAMMNLLGHASPKMTMRYLEVTLTDLQHEFDLARSKPRHLAPQPKAPIASLRAGLGGVVDACSRLNMYWKCSAVLCRRCFPRLPRQALQPAHQDRRGSAQNRHTLKMGRDWPVMPTISIQLREAAGVRSECGLFRQIALEAFGRVLESIRP